MISFNIVVACLVVVVVHDDDGLVCIEKKVLLMHENGLTRLAKAKFPKASLTKRLRYRVWYNLRIRDWTSLKII